MGQQDDAVYEEVVSRVEGDGHEGHAEIKEEKTGTWETPSSEEEVVAATSDPQAATALPDAARTQSVTHSLVSLPLSLPQRLLGGIVWALLWVPPNCRYDPDDPPAFTLGLNYLLSFATTATVANLYYNQSILYKIADSFDVSYEQSSRIATLMQAGYASGLLLLCPLADVLPRRPYILGLVVLTALLWIGLCVTPAFSVFSALSFLTGFTTVTPQLMLPLVGELAQPHRRGTALAIVVSGLSLGMLVARLLAGIVANYTHWRNVYWMSFGFQAAVFFSLYIAMPAYPAKGGWTRGHGFESSAWRRRLRNIAHFAWSMYGGVGIVLVRHPPLVQAALIVFCLSAVFTDYWTTLSFLLSSPPYSYPSTTIGLFSLIGIVVICLGPFYGRFVIDRVVPLAAVLAGNAVELAGVGLGVSLAPISVAGPVLQAVLVDFGNQGSNIALRASIYGLDPAAQNRINSAYMLLAFTGQLTGTSAGNRLYAMGGWRYSGALSLGLLGLATLVCLVRGPRETRRVGWRGGWGIAKDKKREEPVALDERKNPV